MSRSKPIDKWIPWFFVLFFVLLAIVNAAFVTVALKTQPGVVTQQPYERGLAYDNELAAAKELEALGWQAEIALVGDNKLMLNLIDDAQRPLSGAAVRAQVTRPVKDGHDFTLELKDQGNGVYSAPADFPLPGQWNVRIFATWQDKLYQSSRMIMAR